MTTQAVTLYQQLGGREAIATVVEDFYRRILGDERLSPMFAHVDVAGLKRHQAAFLAHALGGPSEYKGRTLRNAHRGLGITPQQFQMVAQHLAAALSACRVPAADAEEVMRRVASLADDVIGQ